jgi:hypothetical protein
MSFEDKKDVQSPEGKKPYSKPRLQVYGDLGAITQSANQGHPTADGGTTSLNKT